MNQGDVYWCSLKPPNKRRPVVVLTRDKGIRYLSSITIAPITTTIRQVPTQVRLTPDDGLPEICMVNLDNVLTVPKSYFDGHIVHLSDAKMQEIYSALHFALGFDNYFPNRN